eukprot:3466270-Pyramimonas_sp.AAC.1
MVILLIERLDRLEWHLSEQQEYSQSLSFYWLPAWNILSHGHSFGRETGPIGITPFRTTGIFSVIVILLVTRMEYSQSWSFFWSRDWTDWNGTFPNNRFGA